MFRALFPALILTGSLAFAATPDRPIKVDFINTLTDPNTQNVTELFDTGYVRTSRAAARQLGIEFRAIPAFRPETMVEETLRLTSGPDRPDYLIITIHRGVGVRLLEIAEQAKLPVFVINAGLLADDRRRFGGPREHYKYWIGQMLPDDEQAGYDLAKLLVAQARRDPRLNHDGRVSMAALAGREVDGAAVERNQGLQRAVAEDPAVTLVQIVPANWDRAVAEAKIPLLLGRYPDVTALWTANDGMAMGAVKGMATTGRQAGKDILVGGMNWDSDAMHAVADGRLTATFGGHFLECVWALILLCDYHHGIDFASERVDWRSEMRPLTRDNVRDYMGRLETMDWDKVDYRHLSKYFSPHLKSYHFSVDELLAPPAAPTTPPNPDRNSSGH